MKPLGIVVLGTDTGVGKTVVAAGLVRALRRRDVSAVPWKPYAAGVDPDRLTPGEDADLLLRAAEWDESRLHDVSPVRLREPLAPAVAARRAGRTIDPAWVLDRRPAGDGPLVVEGCGGLLVPLAPAYDVRELCWDLDLPVVVVARPNLGTINHTALTVAAAEDAGLSVAGVIINGLDPESSGAAELTNAEAISEQSGCAVLGVLPRLNDPTEVDAIADALEEAGIVDALLAVPGFLAPDGRANALDRLDRDAVWHPFTQMKEYAGEQPVVIDRARGAWLFDTRGRRYIDGVASLWVGVHGHRDPDIDRAVRRQLGRVAHSTLLGLGSSAAAECAGRLLAIAPPGLEHVFFSDDGSTAVEVALKMAFQAATQRGEPERRLFVHFDAAYHGDTVGSVSVGGIDLFHRIFGKLLFDALRVPGPRHYRSLPDPRTPDGSFASLEVYQRVLRERGGEVAAVVVEPLMQGAAGMIPQPPGWLRRVADVARGAGALLICDEVATGFGRTGTMFAVEQDAVEPDLLCVAKGLSGGYLPLAATLATSAVYEAFLGESADERTFFHGHTYTGNALACAAASANIDKMLREGTVARAAASGDLLARLLDERVASHPSVGDIRRRGLMVGIELVEDRKTATPYPASRRAAWSVCAAAMERGLRIRPLGDVLVLMPPLAIPDLLLERLVDILRDALDHVLPENRAP